MKKIDYKSLSLIAGNMATLYEQGISMLMIMDLLKELPVKSCYKDSINTIKIYIHEGKSLEESFEDFNNIYPKLFLSMMGVGERSGNLTEVLNGLEEYYSRINTITSKIKNIVAYPIVLILAIFSLAIFMSFFIIPNLYEFYDGIGREMPKACLILLNLVRYIQNNKIISLVYIVSWFILIPYIIFKLFLKELTNIFIFKFSIIKSFYEFIFISLLSIIIKSGIKINIALEYSALSFRNSILKNRFLNLNTNLMHGDTISESLERSGDFSNYTVSIIKLGEESGAIDDRLRFLSKYLEDKFMKSINRYITFLQPGMVLIMGLIVIVFISIFMLPLFNSLLDSGV